MSSSSISTRIEVIRYEAEDILTLELQSADGGLLPAFSPGDHIDLHLEAGLVRSYSLCNDSSERHRYTLGILKDPRSRGGSQHVHERLRVGQLLSVSAPRNRFPLYEDSAHSVLLAGGIGITPILCMARRLTTLGRSAELVYACRSRRSAAYLSELEALGLPLTLHFDDEAGGPPDLRALLGRRAPDSRTRHYACGPSVMLDAFMRLCAELGHPHAHIERFSAEQHTASVEARTQFKVELRRSGIVFEVTPQKSLYRHLLERRIGVPFSCSEGICGSCETRVLEGVPDHRDSVLSVQERAAGRIILPCVSSCRSDRLVLDL
jgi:ferredoxin-NADP reductase